MRCSRHARIVTAIALLTLVAGLLAGCSHGSGSATSGAGTQSDNALAAMPSASAAAGGGKEAAAAPAGAPAAAGADAAQLLADRSVIFTAAITVRTGDIGKAVAAVRRVAADAGGLVYDEQVDLTPKEAGKPGNASATVTLKVPPATLDAVLDAVGKVGTEESRSKSSDDVTSKVVDVNARIQAAQASISRLTELLSHAGNVSDLLAVENQLSSRDAQLESLEQQQKTLQAQTSQATITAHLEATPPVVLAAHAAKTPGFLRGLVGGWHAFVTTVSALLTALGAVLPFVIVVGVAAIVALFIRRRLRARRPQES